MLLFADVMLLYMIFFLTQGDKAVVDKRRSELRAKQRHGHA